MNPKDNAPRRRLAEIINGGADNLRDKWDHAKAASDFTPLPTGTYTAHVLSGKLFTAKTGTPGYKLTFKVIDASESEHIGRLIWHDVWLTEQAMPMAKRDLAKLGIHDVSQL